MTRSDTRQGTAVRTPWWILGCAATAMAVLAGCATPAGGPAGAGASRDIITASDEPEARKRARIRLELAVGYYEQGRTEIALDEVKQALTSDPTFAPAYNLRGLIYMRLNDLGQAEESFRRSLALEPGNPDLLHNLGWLACQQSRWDESLGAFQKALANPSYGARAKTYLTMGLCQARAGRMEEAEHSLARSYELDAGNPVTGYNLASLLMRRGELARAQFYIRRLNNSELANAESLWLGIKVEQRIGDQVAMVQLAEQLRKRYPGSRELAAYDGEHSMNEVVDFAQPESSAGELLRHARERAGVHVAVLAGALKVPQRQLEALEEDQLEQLPDTVYARALAASICRTLHLDPQPVLSRMPKAGDSRLGKKEPINVPFRGGGQSAHGSWRELLARPPVVVAMALTIGAVVLLLLPLIPNQVESSTTTAPVAAEPAAIDAAPAAVDATGLAGAATDSVLPPAGALLPTGTATGDGGVPSAAHLPISAASASPAVSAPGSAVSAISAPATPAGTADASATAATATAEAAGVAAAPVIEFRTVQPSWVQVTSPRGAVHLRRMLAAGETVGISGVTPLSVVIGSASATRVQVRGKAFDLTPHARDNVARFEVR